MSVGEWGLWVIFLSCLCQLLIYICVCRLEGAKEPKVFGNTERAEHPDEEQAGDSRAADSVRPIYCFTGNITHRRVCWNIFCSHTCLSDTYQSVLERVYNPITCIKVKILFVKWWGKKMQLNPQKQKTLSFYLFVYLNNPSPTSHKFTPLKSR